MAAQSHNMGTADDTRRAEFPPARYWRRWCADAPPPCLPEAEPDPVAELALPTAPRPDAMSGNGEPRYRVMIVEDDRSQALFAESVLNGAGMQARVESDPDRVMATLDEFRPDLVLMDLHMPAIDGAELTDMIRSNAAIAHIPIVFLTGDPDPERQFDVLRLGADDFLSKPVRPRHLVTAVENRIKRTRLLQSQRSGEGLHPVTGLYTRARMLQQLSAAVPGTAEGALFFVEIEGVSALRDRIGYAALETVLAQAGRRIAELAKGHPAARLNDNTFLILALQAPADLHGWAHSLRDKLGRHGIDAGTEHLRLRAHIGCAALAPGFDDAGSALSAAEQALRQARAEPAGIALYAPPEQDTDSARALSDLVSSAVTAGRLELAYQPIVAVAGGDEAQYQTLLRVRDAAGTLHTAGEILPVAEANGLLHEMDRQVLELALAVLRQQQQRGTPVRLFVSQSPRSLSRDGHGDWLIQALAAQNTEGAWLVIDVRQDDALIHAISLQEFCAKMVPVGVQLCLSHYRPGEDANALLAQLPLSFVRLATEFSSKLADAAVRDAMRDAVDRAHRLGLQVVGQQVEDPQAAATLWMSGIDYIQGNLVQQVAGDLDFDFHHSVL